MKKIMKLSVGILLESDGKHGDEFLYGSVTLDDRDIPFGMSLPLAAAHHAVAKRDDLNFAEKEMEINNLFIVINKHYEVVEHEHFFELI